MGTNPHEPWRLKIRGAVPRTRNIEASWWGKAGANAVPRRPGEWVDAISWWAEILWADWAEILSEKCVGKATVADLLLSESEIWTGWQFTEVGAITVREWGAAEPAAVRSCLNHIPAFSFANWILKHFECGDEDEDDCKMCFPTADRHDVESWRRRIKLSNVWVVGPCLFCQGLLEI